MAQKAQESELLGQATQRAGVTILTFSGGIKVMLHRQTSLYTYGVAVSSGIRFLVLFRVANLQRQTSSFCLFIGTVKDQVPPNSLPELLGLKCVGKTLVATNQLELVDNPTGR